MIEHTKYIDRIGIEITLRCNRVCANCNRLFGWRTPPKSDMTIDQIRYFIKEAQGRTFFHIWVIGGEPLIHPQFEEIWKLLYESRLTNQLILNTNGTLPIPNYVKLRQVASPPKPHGNIYVDPQDMGYPVEGCDNPEICGMCLNAFGYHLCGAGFSIVRLLGLEDNILYHLPVTMDEWKNYDDVCKHCHRASRINPTISSEEPPYDVPTSKTFAKALKTEEKKYKRYGE